MIKCYLILGDVLEAETVLKKLQEFDSNNESISAEQKDITYVRKFLKDADIAYNVKDYRKVKSLCSDYIFIPINDLLIK